MCGISGIHHFKSSEPISLDVLRRMILSLKHRGPDEFGLYRDARTGFASARLSIIDLSGGQQPMSNEDGSLWIVFNGEIFNYIELRPGLEAKGHIFATNSDTEVILHLYEEYGPNCLTHLNGQFAIAIWDSKNQTLFLARDRLGIRPLFYMLNETRLVFASEIKAFLALPDWQPQFDSNALEQVFTYWSPLSSKSVFQGVEQIQPGHYLVCKEGQISTAQYWSLDFTETPLSDSQNVPAQEDKLLEEFSALLIDATRIRLRADVPVGAYLSGGLDSSTIAAVIRDYTNTHLDSFSIAFSTPQYNESEFQLRMADHLGTYHQVVNCTPEDIGLVFPEVIWHTEMPILRTAPAPMFLLSRLVNQNNYKVVLTGEGADEFLGGYDIFKEMKIRRFVARQPDSKLRPQLFKELYPDIPRLGNSGSFLTAFFSKDLSNTGSPFYSHLLRWSNTARTLRFFAEEKAGPNGDYPLHLPKRFSAWSHLAQAQYLEITTFLSPYLLSSQGDRPGMANSVEGRFPFLDVRLVEFCNRLPASLKLRVLNEKYLLRRFASQLLPKEIWTRKKRPYRAPIQASFFGPNPEKYTLDLLSAGEINAAGIFNPLAIGKLVAKARGDTKLSEIEEMALVGIISTQLVNKMFVRREHMLNEHTTAPFRVVDHALIG